MSYFHQNGLIIDEQLLVGPTGHVVTSTKGDLLVDTGVRSQALAVGTNQQVLAANSATATGLEWTTLTPASVGLGNVLNTKVNYTATTNPSASDDSSAGYTVGSTWINTTTDTEYTLVDATVGAAIWSPTTFTTVVAGSNKISVVNSPLTNSVTVDVVPANINVTTLAGLPAGDLVGTTAAQTLSNKNLVDASTTFVNNIDNTKHMVFSLGGLPTASSVVLSVPPASTTVAGTDSVQTLTNKTFGDNLNMGSHSITNLASPTNPTDAVNKQYVDGIAQGLEIKAACFAASTTSLASNTSITGVPTYNPTGGVAASGLITATLVASNSFVIDGVTLTSAQNNTRILLKNQTPATQNGIWTTTISGTTLTLNRALDFNLNANVTTGAFTFIQTGTVNAGTGWVLTTPPPVTVGGATGSNLVFAQFSEAGSPVAGNGINITGNVISAVGSPTIISNGAGLSVNSGGTVGQPLISQGASGTAAAYGPLNLTTATNVSGILPVLNGGTGSSSFATANSFVATNGTNSSLVTSGLTTANYVTTTNTVTLTNKTLTNPIISTHIADTNSNAILAFNPAANAVNQLSATNAATGVAPVLSAVGSDANIGLNLVAKGTGRVSLNSLVFPPTDNGMSNQVLGTNGSNTLSFVSTPVLQTNPTVLVTNGTTVTTLITIPTATNMSYMWEISVIGKRTDVGAGFGNTGGWYYRSIYANVNGTVGKVGESKMYSSSDLTWNVVTTISGTNVLVQVQGSVGSTVSWNGTVQNVTV